MITDWSDFGLGIIVGMIMVISAMIVKVIFDAMVDEKARILADKRYEMRLKKFWADRLRYAGKDINQFERDTAKKDLMGFESKKGGE